MVKVLLVLIAAVSWYLAGVFHSFAIMLYAVCLAVFMLVMHIITRIYKKKTTFSFETEYICAAKDIECPVAINIKNNSGIPVSRIRLDIEVRYGFHNNMTAKQDVLKHSVYASCRRKKEVSVFKLKFPYTGPACIYLKAVYMYDYTGSFRVKLRTNDYMNVTVLPVIEKGRQSIETFTNDSNSVHEMYINKAGNSIDDIRQIREYQTDDSYRHIHWNLSARSGSLLVKEFSQETDVKINVIAQVTPDILDDYRKMGDYYDKLAAEAMSLVSDKSIVSLMWYDYEYDAYTKHGITTKESCEDALYELFVYHEKCRINDKKDCVCKELTYDVGNENMVVVNVEDDKM